MARRIPQNRDALNAARRARSIYATEYEAAASLNISTGTLRKIVRGRGRVRDSTAARMMGAIGSDDLTTIAVSGTTSDWGLQQMVQYYESTEHLSAGQRKSYATAVRALDRAEAAGKSGSDRVERPKMRHGLAEWRLGRGRDEGAYRAWAKDMRKRGYKGDLRAYYNEKWTSPL